VGDEVVVDVSELETELLRLFAVQTFTTQNSVSEESYDLDVRN
jgi:hypothetical protein